MSIDRPIAKEWRDVIRTAREKLEKGEFLREILPCGGRIHVDRLLPFLVVHHPTDDQRDAAREVAQAHASYLLTYDSGAAQPLVEAVLDVLRTRLGAALLLEVAEFAEDTLYDATTPDLSPFRISLRSDAASGAAATAIVEAISNTEVLYRRPQIERADSSSGDGGANPRIRLCFAPIYCQPGSDRTYPELRERVIANIFDATLKGLWCFAKAHGIERPASYRGLGRAVFVETVTKLDAQIDAICSSFDLLLAVTPINAQAAWEEFRDGGFRTAPMLYYRPLPLDVSATKRALHGLPFRHLEDPVLYELYREKQAEVDLQLSLMAARSTPRFLDLSCALYGRVSERELTLARGILALPDANRQSAGGVVAAADLAEAARSMISGYRARHPDFAAEVVLREDIPAGMMVSGPQLLVSTASRVPANRVEALLSHEIGVHLLTFNTGDAQGLKLLRNGLAGYEGMQEGLAVFAEYLTGGLTKARLVTLAARTVGCAAMIEGAGFVDVFRLLTGEHALAERRAYDVTLRLFRSGGFAKDAIYLRGLLRVLEHLERGLPLDPFWMGKVAASHFPVLVELAERGLLRPAAVEPAFMSGRGTSDRLVAARRGLDVVDLVAA